MEEIYYSSEYSGIKGRILTLIFGGDRYFAAKQRARLRVRFPRAYAQLEWIILKIGIRWILRLIMAFRSKRRPYSLATFHSEEELGRWLKKENKTNIGKSLVISGSEEGLKRCLDELGLSMFTTILAKEQPSQAQPILNIEKVDIHCKGSILEHLSPIVVKDAIEKGMPVSVLMGRMVVSQPAW
ncbi:hypothetical protein ACFLV3_06725 [Chloroflexota bacterium]